MDEKIQNLMSALGIDEETARQVIADDERIDKGEKLFELSAEQKQAEKKMRQADRKKNSAPIARERKADNEKRELVESLRQALVATCQSVEVINQEREIIVQNKGRKFKVVLSAPRGKDYETL